MMAQWFECKKKSPDALLLFQLGDFYEAFYDDAVVMSKELELTLTKRQETPMAGVPVHSVENYIERLIGKGYKVAIAEQTSDPLKTKGLVKREIVRVVTPGAHVGSQLTPAHSNNFFVSLTQVGSLFGLAYIDISTGEFQVSEMESFEHLRQELLRLKPSECYTSYKFKEKHKDFLEELNTLSPFLTTAHDDWRFDHQLAYEALVQHFKVQSVDGFGLKAKVAAINAAGALLTYLRDTLMQPVDHIQSLSTYTSDEYMELDYLAEKHLELVDPQGSNKTSTLFYTLNQTRTAMGGRLLKTWIKQPLLDLEKLQGRQEAVSTLLGYPDKLQHLEEMTSKIRDTERLISKIGSRLVSPRDFTALAESFRAIAELKALLSTLPLSPLLQEVEQKLNPLPELTQLIQRAIAEEPALRLGEGDVIQEGYSEKLDELRRLRKDSHSWIACYQTHLREQTGIKTLKVGYSRAFGYHIEVSKGQADKMPHSFARRQTLTNSERFISPELKTYETKILSAEEEALRLETELFTEVRTKVMGFAAEVQVTSKAVAYLDVLQCFAKVAQEQGYTCPELTNGYDLEIVEGRHPVVERILGANFVCNDANLSHGKEQLMIITGPNMSGKSTYIRQVALIVLMAQIGSFVPAKSAKIGLVDKIFTRIGASDDLFRGQSTFMVEMAETASILNNVTDRSLVILDEIGRGTSTYDGISIAWAVAEFLLTAEGKRAKTLFATHYFELTKLPEKVPMAVNYHIAVQEVADHIIFLHKILPGGADRSWGIHVARLAGMPSWVIERSGDILKQLEDNRSSEKVFTPEKPKRLPPVKKKKARAENQLSFL